MIPEGEVVGSRRGSDVRVLLGALGRLVQPTDVVSGHLTVLLGTFWLTGGAWVLFAWSLGLYDEGWSAAAASLGAASSALGVGLLIQRHRRLGRTLDVTFTLLGSLAITLVVLWGGQRAAGVTGLLYVYVVSFAAISLRREAALITVVSAGMHLVALIAAGYEAGVAVWVVTWGSAAVAGVVIGAAVAWLQEFVARLEAADEHKTRFVATVSHELRTPLTAIIGFSETLQRDWDRLGEADRRRYIGVIGRQAARQFRLVEDVLTMATLMEGSITPRPERIELRGLVTQLTEALPFDVEVEVPASITAVADPDHLERVLENLLVNADRYGAPPLTVRAASSDDGVWIDVVDHGAGIVGGFEGGVLEPFVQGDGGDRRTSVGVGLGLTLCRDLLALNGGRLEYAETPGGGATLRVVVPDR